MEQERLQKVGKSILSFRGYLIAGLPKGMGRGLLAQKAAMEKQKEAAEKNKKNAIAQTIQLEDWLVKAEAVREQYRVTINDIIKKTATEFEKENVAAILRGQSSIYANKTVDDFRNNMYLSVFINTFIKTYYDRFEPRLTPLMRQYDAIMQEVVRFDKSKYKKLFY